MKSKTIYFIKRNPGNKKVKFFLILSLAFLVVGFQTHAQEDVTATYLTNAGFDLSCNYLNGGTDNVPTADPGNLASVYGWTIGSAPAWSAGATFEYGWNGDFNNTTTPSLGSDGSSGSGHGCLGLTAGWSGNINYQQEITLSPGKYGIEYTFLFLSVNNISNNTCGWVPNSGTAVYSDLTTVSNTGTWTTDEVTFTISKETTGYIQLGMQAYGSSSTENARMFIDQVKILSYGADKTLLQELLDSASVMKANPENIPEGSTAYSDLETTISDAQIVLNNASATVEEVIAAEESLIEAINIVYAAIFEYSLGNPNIDNPVDITQKIINPDFEDNGGSTYGWTTGLGIYSGSNAVFNGAPNPNHVMDGDPSSTTVGYQTVTGIPEGIYKVKAIARGNNDGDAYKMFIGAEAGSVFGSANRINIEVDRIGDTGGELNYGFNQYETPYVVVPSGVNAITFGIYFEGNCGWSSVDNFELIYYGEADTLVDLLKVELTALKDSSNMPAGYDLSNIESLLSTEPTSENLVALTIDLQNTIQLLQDNITQNIDATLSDIKVDGLSIGDFSPSIYEYDYHIYSSTPQTPPVPTVTATKSSTYATDPVFDYAAEVPDTTYITVTAGNGTIKTYAIRFDFVLLTKHENLSATFETYQNKSVELSGVGQLTITGDTDPLNGSTINLVSPDVWIYFPNMRPSDVNDTQLKNFRVDGQIATEGSNIRISQYLTGTMVIPHSITHEAMKVFEGSHLSGTSMNLQINKYYKASDLGGMNDNIESFILERGYMATFASNEDGTGISRVYIADETDLKINSMPEGLSNTASFVIIRQWRWVTKKAWVSGPEEWPLRFGATSFYDYYNANSSTLNVEFIPMAADIGAINSNFLDRLSSTHALFLNEPGNASDGETNTVEEAIAAWPRMMESGLRLGTPANTDGGLNWLYNFVDQCDALNYRVDFVAWHFYRAGYTAQSLYNTLKAVHERTGRPLWITEWNNGCNWTYDGNVPSIEENGEVIKAFTAMMDTTSFIERYFVWNGCNEELRMTNSSTGEMYPAGIAYRDQVSSMAYTKDYYNKETKTGSTTIQENSGGVCNIDGVLNSTYSGYTATGYIDADNAIGSGINWKVMFTSTGTKTLTFRYASTSDITADLIMNGDTIASDLYFISSGGLTRWYTLPVNINTEAGITDIRLESTVSSGLPNIDYLKVTNGYDVDCSTSLDSSDVLIQENFIGFCLYDGTIINAADGATGDGAVNIDNSFGSGINYRVNFISDGAKSITIRYSSENETASNVAINGVIVADSVSFPVTGSNDIYSTITIPFDADSGTVNLRIEATTNAGLGYIDYIIVTDATAADCLTDDDLSTGIELKHSYTFDDGTANDVEGTAHGIMQGGTIINGAYHANSNGQFISLPASEININTYSNITLEAYIVAGSGNNGNSTMLSYFGGNAGNNAVNYLYTSLKSRTAISCLDSIHASYTESGISWNKIEDGKKHHVVCVITRQDIRWYIDGKLIGIRGLYSKNKISSLSNEFAYLCKSGNTNDPTWQGVIEEFNIYEGIMDADSIAKRSSAYSLSLKHSYTFDDGTAADVISGADGTAIGGTIVSGSYTSSRSGQYVELPAAEIAINTYNSITLEAFIKDGSSTNGSNAMLSYFGGVSGDYGVNYLFTSHKSKVAISCNNLSSPWSAESSVSSTELDDGLFHHLVCVLTNETISWYIDGELAGTSDLSSNNSIEDIATSYAYLCKSGYSADPTWFGSIYEYNIYEGIMLGNKIADRYNAYTTASYTLNYTASEHGSITGESQQTIDLGKNGTSVSAIADPGYIFTEWSDGSKSNPRTDLSVGTDISVTALFEKASIVTLTIKNNEVPIVGAVVNFNSTNYTADSNGEVVINNVLNGEYNITVTANGYDTYTDVIAVSGVDIQQEINLILSTYTISLTVKEGNLKIDDAVVTFGIMTDTTDANGMVTFNEILSGNYPLSISAKGYNDYNSEITVNNEDVTQDIQLTTATYTISLTVKNGNDPVAGAIVNLNFDADTTDIEGKVEYTNLVNGDYYLVIESDGFKKYTDIVTIYYSDVTMDVSLTSVGIENNRMGSLAIYPNPASTVVTIESDFTLSNVRVFDSYGKLMLEETNIINNSQVELKISELEKGMYLLHIHAGDAAYIEKLIIK